MTDQKEIQLKHIDIIQSVISRLAQNSFVVKGWSITIVSAIFAFLETQQANKTAYLLTLVPALFFWGLDAFYQRQERLFRELHDAVAEDIRSNTATVELLDMDRSKYEKEVSGLIRTLFARTVWPIPTAIITVNVFYVCLNS